jgi:hypothetical protein
VKDKASFLPKPGVFTPRFAASHHSCFMKDDLPHLMALSDRIFKHQHISLERVCGLYLAPMKATRAIQQKKSSWSPRSLKSSHRLDLPGPTVAAISDH